MPNNTGIPVIMASFMFVAGFGFVFEWYWMGIPGLIGVIACMIARSFVYNDHHYISIDEIKRTEAATGRLS
jgi:cytochrome aa3-600 menaquinol oxidase subunit 1